MKYNNIVPGRFLSRPNRFVAICEIDGVRHKCHVKNTGRCRELLIEDALVLLERSDNPNRKTPYDLIGVYKGRSLINIDSQAPNKVFKEYIPQLFDGVTRIKPEYTYGQSRIDFLVECGKSKKLIEVKGVTLEANGIALFPDAPTERGVKHINELTKAIDEGYECYIAFIVQMENIRLFKPNYFTHSAFGDALVSAQKRGVTILALGCSVTEDSLNISYEIPVDLAK